MFPLSPLKLSPLDQSALFTLYNAVVEGCGWVTAHIIRTTEDDDDDRDSYYSGDETGSQAVSAWQTESRDNKVHVNVCVWVHVYVRVCEYMCSKTDVKHASLNEHLLCHVSFWVCVTGFMSTHLFFFHLSFHSLPSHTFIFYPWTPCPLVLWGFSFFLFISCSTLSLSLNCSSVSFICYQRARFRLLLTTFIWVFVYLRATVNDKNFNFSSKLNGESGSEMNHR